MFDNKKKSLFEVPTSTKEVNNFVVQGLKSSVEIESANGSIKYSSTGNDFVDQFGGVGQYLSPRSYAEVSKDMQLLYSQDKLMTLKFTLYLRTISRKVKLFDGTTTEEVQRGVGLKHEAISRMIWLETNDRDIFWENIQLFIGVGSWKDIFEMLRYDLQFHGFENKVLNWNNFATLILAGIENPETSELVKKYLPKMYAKLKATTLRKQANTIIAKFLANRLFGKDSYKKYRLLKSSGKAHNWQQLISKKLFKDINFDTIHGRALSSLVSSKFLENHDLEETYTKWIESKPVAKFTGYVHELAMKIGSPNMCGRNRKVDILSPYQKMTINRQYDGLLNLAKEGVDTKSGLIVVRDTSSSMTSMINGAKISSYDVAKALGIFFGGMLEGAFKDTWIEFHNKATMHQLKGKTFVDKWLNDNSESYGSTNFQGVVDLFIDLKKKGVSEKDFPSGMICISDGELNRIGNVNVSNFEHARARFRDVGFSSEFCNTFKFVMWDIPNNFYSNNSGTKFETFGEAENVFYLSGYDGSILSFLLGGEGMSQEGTPKTDVELFESAMNQTILNLIKV